MFNRSRIAKLLLTASCLVSISVQAHAAEMLLAWDPVRNNNLEGYGIYFSVNGEPESFYGYVAKNELTHPDYPSLSLNGFDPGTSYCFSVSAYDKWGNEGPKSKPVCGQVGPQ